MAARSVRHPLARLTRQSHSRSPRGALQARIWQRAPLVTPATRLASLAQLGSSRPFVGGTVLVLVGGGIAYATLTGRAPLLGALRSRVPVGEREQGLVVERGVTIQRPTEELYRFWRDFEHLPPVLPHLMSVTAGPDGRSHWVTSGPAGRSVAWDAEIVEERPNELIRWQSLPGAQVANRARCGSCRRPATGAPRCGYGSRTSRQPAPWARRWRNCSARAPTARCGRPCGASRA